MLRLLAARLIRPGGHGCASSRRRVGTVDEPEPPCPCSEGTAQVAYLTAFVAGLASHRVRVLREPLRVFAEQGPWADELRAVSALSEPG